MFLFLIKNEKKKYIFARFVNGGRKIFGQRWDATCFWRDFNMRALYGRAINNRKTNNKKTSIRVHTTHNNIPGGSPVMRPSRSFERSSLCRHEQQQQQQRIRNAGYIARPYFFFLWFIKRASRR